MTGLDERIPGNRKVQRGRDGNVVFHSGRPAHQINEDRFRLSSRKLSPERHVRYNQLRARRIGEKMAGGNGEPG